MAINEILDSDNPIKDSYDQVLDHRYSVLENKYRIGLPLTYSDDFITSLLTPFSLIDSFTALYDDVYFVLNEISHNMLEHSILQLDSSIKTNAQGFNLYYQLRSQLLKFAIEKYPTLNLIFDIKYHHINQSLMVSIESAIDFPAGFKEALKAYQIALLSAINIDYVPMESDSNLFFNRGQMLILQRCNQYKYDIHLDKHYANLSLILP